MIWQTPTISLAIISVILAGVISQKFILTTSSFANAIALLILFAFAFAVSLVATIQLSRHRLFAEIRYRELRHIEACLSGFGVQPRFILSTNEDIDGVGGSPALKKFYKAERGLLARQSAYRWLRALMIAVTLSLLIATVLLPILLVVGII